MSKIQRRSRSPISGDEDEGTFLPEEVVVSEILVRLPLKPLFRFKCVSKRYNSIVSDPGWGHDYMQRGCSSRKRRSSLGLTPSLLYPFTNQKSLKDTTITDSIRIASVSLPSSRNGDETHKILGSSNGLTLSLFHPHDPNPLDNEKKFILCVSNPLTKQSVSLPELSSPPQVNYSVNWVFGIVASWFAERRPAYKVVLIRKVGGGDHGPINVSTSTCIFSSETGRWVTWDQVTCPRDIFSASETSQLSHKGNLHWVFARSDAIMTYNPFNSPGEFKIISLPTDKRSLRFKTWPDGSRSMNGSQCLVYARERGDLWFVQITRRDQNAPGTHTLRMWHHMGSRRDQPPRLWWKSVVRPSKYVVPCEPYICERLLIAPTCNVLCHPFVVDNKVTVLHLDPDDRDPSMRREAVDMVLETPEGFDQVGGGYRNPLVPIDWCPWACPSFLAS